jgi:hypothetical protein
MTSIPWMIPTLPQGCRSIRIDRSGTVILEGHELDMRRFLAAVKPSLCSWRDRSPFSSMPCANSMTAP